MTRHALCAVVPTLFLATSLGAQSSSAARHPIKDAHGSGQLPKDWQMQFDPREAGSGHPPYRIQDVDVQLGKKGIVVASGPPALYFRAQDLIAGEYTATVTFSQPASVGHEAYGLFIGGQSRSGKITAYLYVILRVQNPAYSVKSRIGDADPKVVLPWVLTPAVNEERGRMGSSTNTLTLRVTREWLHIVINQVNVDSISKGKLGDVSTDGIVGLRINHNIVVEAQDFTITRAKTVSPPKK